MIAQTEMTAHEKAKVVLDSMDTGRHTEEGCNELLLRLVPEMLAEWEDKTLLFLRANELPRVKLGIHRPGDETP